MDHVSAPEKSVNGCALTEPGDDARGADAPSRLAGMEPLYFVDSTLTFACWSGLSFYPVTRLMDLQPTRDGTAERGIVLHGPAGTFWLNGLSDPWQIDTVNPAPPREPRGRAMWVRR